MQKAIDKFFRFFDFYGTEIFVYHGTIRVCFAKFTDFVELFLFSKNCVGNNLYAEL